MTTTDEKQWAYREDRGDWSVRGSYEEPNNIEFLYKGEVFTTRTCAGYQIWNFAAHLPDYIAELEKQRAAAAETSEQLSAVREAAWARASDEERSSYIAGAFHALSAVFGIVTEVLQTPNGDLHEVGARLRALLATYDAAFIAKERLP